MHTCYQAGLAIFLQDYFLLLNRDVKQILHFIHPFLGRSIETWGRADVTDRYNQHRLSQIPLKIPIGLLYSKFERLIWTLVTELNQAILGNNLFRPLKPLASNSKFDHTFHKVF